MRLFGFDIKRSEPAKKTSKRYYQAAKGDRLTSDWLTTNLVADEILRWQLKVMRARSRDLAINNDYVKNFLRSLKVNVIGPDGIGFQSKVRLKNGTLDVRANKLIETAWSKWSKKQNASVCGTLSLRDILNLILESVARDGEALIRKVKGYDNPFGFALQNIESDHLDEFYNKDLENGNKIRLGVEKNPWGKPVAYWLFEKHPGDVTGGVTPIHIRVPANEIIHVFIKERPTQSRGVPWPHTAIIRLRMLGAYEEAAVVNARIGASKTQSIIAGDGEKIPGDDEDPYGNISEDVAPGMREVLPYGTQIHDSHPLFPNNEHAPFTKAMLRGVASGLGISYNGLANDLENVNFSSLRAGTLAERDVYKFIQLWLIEHTLDDVQPDFLEMAALSGQIPFAVTDIERLNSPSWHPRSWPWVDPVKDINSKISEMAAKITSPQRVCAEKGVDLEDILEEWAEAEKMAKEKGLTFDFAAASQIKPENPQNIQGETVMGDEQPTGGNGNGNKSKF